MTKANKKKSQSMDPFSDSIDEDNDESDLLDGFDIEEELEDQSVSNNGIQNPSQNKHLLELKETLGKLAH